MHRMTTICSHISVFTSMIISCNNAYTIHIIAYSIEIFKIIWITIYLTPIASMILKILLFLTLQFF